jgi:hypothetical protein
MENRVAFVFEGRTLWLDPVTAEKARAKLKGYNAWSEQKSRELGKSGVLPRSYRNASGSGTMSGSYQSDKTEKSNYTSWNESKKARLNEDFENFKPDTKSSLERMNEAFSKINLVA